ncbi:MAG: DUF2961 domain-containing protein [Bacteroidales bacterium]|nr:DUF2961 domain-containing protein [Bacteroidales bacterium]
MTINKLRQKSTQTNTTSLYIIAVLYIIVGFPHSTKSQEVTTGTLLQEMITLENLAEFPSPAYNTIQFSSYDRRSINQDVPGWFDNSDGFGGESIPGFEKVLKEPDKKGIGEYLVCDVKGPGAIVRLWTAAIYGTVKLYLDDNTVPIYEGDANDFFQHTYKVLASSDNPLFDGTFTQYAAGYYPIPFAKRCKIIWIGNLMDLHFYHVNVRLYEEGTRVITFKTDDIKTFTKQIRQVAEVLKDPDANFELNQSDIQEFALNVESGQIKDLIKVTGNKAIRYFEMKVLAADLSSALRQTVLNISFDNASEPQVQSPVGDFFGTAAGIHPYQSLPFTVLKDGSMICRFFMPFKESATIQIENLGDNDITLTGSINITKYAWVNNRSMYFRARWRVDHDLIASGERPYDIPFLLTSGKGRYVGAAIHLMNPVEVPPVYWDWWGEGDEKIFVDDNSFPVFFGTGSEDYFNYTWSSSDIFAYGYCGQPCNDGPGTRGFITNYRWHILDDIPYKNQFGFYMELLTHKTIPGFIYARIVYHYGFPGMHDDHIRISPGDVRKLILPEKRYIPVRKSPTDALYYQAEDLAEKKNNLSLVSGRLWSGNQLLVWEPKSLNDELVLNLPIPEDGKYKVYITARLTDQSGACGARINEYDFMEKGSNIDFHTEHGILSRTFDSNQVELKKGMQKLILKSSHQGNLPIGIDFIWIQKSQ